jgi:ribosomal protein S18 acetylase RimI-like enzyme
MMHIRQVTTADLPSIVEFEIEIARISFPDNPVTDPDVHHKKLLKALKKEPDGMFVIDVKDQIVGWLWITINKNFVTGEKYATFRSLALRPEWRGQEMARSFVEFGIDYCRRCGARWITGKVHVNNLPMRVLYRDTGFHAKHLTMEFRLEDGTGHEA